MSDSHSIYSSCHVMSTKMKCLCVLQSFFFFQINITVASHQSTNILFSRTKDLQTCNVFAPQVMSSPAVLFFRLVSTACLTFDPVMVDSSCSWYFGRKRCWVDWSVVGLKMLLEIVFLSLLDYAFSAQWVVISVANNFCKVFRLLSQSHHLGKLVEFSGRLSS